MATRYCKRKDCYPEPHKASWCHKEPYGITDFCNSVGSLLHDHQLMMDTVEDGVEVSEDFGTSTVEMKVTKETITITYHR